MLRCVLSLGLVWALLLWTSQPYSKVWELQCAPCLGLQDPVGQELLSHFPMGTLFVFPW